MKKVLLQGVILSAVCAASLLLSCNSSNNAPPAADDAKKLAEDSLRASIERGKYLAYHVAACMDCHSHRDMTKYGGPMVPGTEGMGGEVFGPLVGVPGELHAPNITPAGLKDWTDAEIIRAMTEGVNKKGDTLFPLMPYLAYSQMPLADVQDIVHFLRSLPAIENTPPARKLFIPIAAAVPPLSKPNLAGNTKPDPQDQVKYGEYLVKIASCSDCHTPRVNGVPDFARYLAGGNSFSDGKFSVVSANITQDTVHGIGKWTEAMFMEKIAHSAARVNDAEAPGAMNTYMPWSFYAGMKTEDLKAIYAFLKTVKPIPQAIVKWPPPSKAGKKA